MEIRRYPALVLCLAEELKIRQAGSAEILMLLGNHICSTS